MKLVLKPGGAHARVDRRELAAIFAGGFVGAVLRTVLVQSFVNGRAEWPWITFSVNLLGAFLLGYFATRLQERLPLSPYRRSFLGTGFCGALTTFSTMQLELLRMIDAGDWVLAGSYAAASIVGGLASVLLGTNLARRARIAL